MSRSKIESSDGEVDGHDGHHDEHDRGGLERAACRVGQLTFWSSAMTSGEKREPARCWTTALVTVPAFSACAGGPPGERAAGSGACACSGAGVRRARGRARRRPGSACRLPSGPCPRAGRMRAIVRSALHVVVDDRAGGTRTPNPRFWRPVLYQLSYDPSRESPATAQRLPGLLVRRVPAAPSTELPELDAVRRVPPALHCLVVPTLALLASHRHGDALAGRHR